MTRRAIPTPTPLVLCEPVPKGQTPRPDASCTVIPQALFTYRIDTGLLARQADHIARVFSNTPDHALERLGGERRELSYFDTPGLMIHVRFYPDASDEDVANFIADHRVKAHREDPYHFEGNRDFWMTPDLEGVALTDLERLGRQLGLSGEYVFSSELLATFFQEYFRMRTHQDRYRAIVAETSFWVENG